RRAATLFPIRVCPAGSRCSGLSVAAELRIRGLQRLPSRWFVRGEKQSRAKTQRRKEKPFALLLCALATWRDIVLAFPLSISCAFAEGFFNHSERAFGDLEVLQPFKFYPFDAADVVSGT